MMDSTKSEITPTVRGGVLALVAVLGVPAVLYFALRGPLGGSTANGLALGSSVAIAVVVALLLWQKR